MHLREVIELKVFPVPKKQTSEKSHRAAGCFCSLKAEI